jgi:hypothetical protein
MDGLPDTGQHPLHLGKKSGGGCNSYRARTAAALTYSYRARTAAALTYEIYDTIH